MRSRYIALALSLGLSACGGGAGSGSGVTPPASSPAPLVSPSPPIQNTASTSVAVGTQAGNATLPSVAGFSEMAQIPAANAAGSLQITISTAPPPGIPGVSTAAFRRNADGVPATALLYFTITSPGSLILGGVPGLTIITPPTVKPQQAFYLAGYTGQGWQQIAGPVVAQGQTVNLSSSPGSLMFNAGDSIILAFYATTPIFASPSQIQLLSLTASQTVGVTDLVGSAQLSIDGSSCSGVANVGSLSSGTLSVSAVSTGTCSVTITDNYSNTLDVPVSVTTTKVIIQ